MSSMKKIAAGMGAGSRPKITANRVLWGLLALSLVWAYWVSHPSGSSSTGGQPQIELWSIAPQDIARVVYQKDKTRVEILPSWEDNADKPYVWVNSTHPAPKKPPLVKPAAPDKPKAPEAGLETSVFQGNINSVRLLEFLARPQARRVLGNLDDLDGKGFGLPSKSHQLEIFLAGEEDPLRLELGKETASRQDTYALSSRDNRVYLIRKARVDPLAVAHQRLREQRVWPFQPIQADRVEVTRGKQKKVLWRHEDKRNWTLDQARLEPLPTGMQLVQALSSLAILAYEPETAPPAPTSPEVMLEIRLFKVEGGKENAWIRVFQKGAEKRYVIGSYVQKAATVRAQQVENIIGKIEAVFKTP